MAVVPENDSPFRVGGTVTPTPTLGLVDQATTKNGADARVKMMTDASTKIIDIANKKEQEARNYTDRLRAMENANELAKEAMLIQYGDDTHEGWANRKGEDAFTLDANGRSMGQIADDSLQKKMQTILDTRCKTPAQRLALFHSYNQVLMNQRAGMTAHATKQYETWTAGVFNNAVDTAYKQVQSDNPLDQQTGISSLGVLAEGYAQKTGKPIAEARRETIGPAYSLLVGQLIDQGDLAGAKGMLENAKPDMKTEQYQKLVVAVQKAQETAEADSKADALFSKYGLSGYVSALKATDKISNPNMRKEVQARLGVLHARAKEQEQQNDREALRAAIPFIEKASSVPSSVYRSCTPETRLRIKEMERSAMRRVAAEAAGAGSTPYQQQMQVNNEVRKKFFTLMAIDPESAQSFDENSLIGSVSNAVVKEIREAKAALQRGIKEDIAVVKKRVYDQNPKWKKRPDSTDIEASIAARVTDLYYRRNVGKGGHLDQTELNGVADLIINGTTESGGVNLGFAKFGTKTSHIWENDIREKNTNVYTPDPIGKEDRVTARAALQKGFSLGQQEVRIADPTADQVETYATYVRGYKYSPAKWKAATENLKKAAAEAEAEAKKTGKPFNPALFRPTRANIEGQLLYDTLISNK